MLSGFNLHTPFNGTLLRKPCFVRGDETAGIQRKLLIAGKPRPVGGELYIKLAKDI
jgi:hypothetical protein